MIKRIFRHTTDTADQKSAPVDLFECLQVRGRQATEILATFLAALANVSKPPLKLTTKDPDAPPLFLHLRYNPFNVSSKAIQVLFHKYLSYIQKTNRCFPPCSTLTMAASDATV